MEGLALAIVVISLLSLAGSVLAVAGRAYVRLSERAFGVDDRLIVAGTIVYAADTALACYAAFTGIGSPDSQHNAFLTQEGKKFFTLWILVYVLALALVKSSVCATMMRVAAGPERPTLRAAIWALLAITWASFAVTFVGVLAYCRPVAANWDAELVASGRATCGSIAAMVGLSQTATATTIVTDLGCAILPGIVLWNVQMGRGTKWEVFFLLSFGSMASFITIARAPFIQHYEDPLNNLMYYLGYLVLLSEIETSIGCIASSIPMLRRLVRGRARGGKGNTAPPAPSGPAPFSVVTIGSKPIQAGGGSSRRNLFRNPTDIGFSVATVHARGNSEWERIHDGDSDGGFHRLPNLDEEGGRRDGQTTGGGNGIHAEYTYSVELSKLPEDRASYRTGDSAEV